MIPISNKTSNYLASEFGKEYAGFGLFKHVLLFSTTEELQVMLGISPEKARSTKKWLVSNLNVPFNVIGLDRLKKLSKGMPSSLVPTRSENFNEMMGGGFQGGRIYDIFGAPASGKTQVCFQGIIDFLTRPEFKDHDVLFVDSDLTFRPERIVQMSGNPGILNKILVSKCYSPDHLKMILKKIEDRLKKGTFVPLIVFDSLFSNYFSIFVEDSLKRQTILLEIMEHLKLIAINYNVCIIFTNRVGPGILAPAGGNILIDYSDFIISLEKPSQAGENRVIRLVKSPNLPEAIKKFKITSNGIEDA